MEESINRKQRPVMAMKLLWAILYSWTCMDKFLQGHKTYKD